MSIWLYINILLFITVVFTVNYSYTQLPLHLIFGLAGLLLVLFNWTRHAVFSTIRNSNDRKKKIKLANFSKKVYPFHRWVGSTALLLIIIHAWLIISRYGFIATSWKMLSGIVAGTILFAMVATGWLRLYWPSGRRRRAHLLIGFLLFFFIAIHTLIF